MELGDAVKYTNMAYAGLMIGLAVYFIILIKYGYTFLPPSGTVTVGQLLSSGPLGPSALGVVPALLVVVIVATIAVVLLNMVYENSLKPREKEVKRREGTRKGEEKRGKKR